MKRYIPDARTWPPERGRRMLAVVQTAIFRSFGGKPKGQG